MSRERPPKKAVAKAPPVRVMEQKNQLLEASNTTLRQDNAKLRKAVVELEEKVQQLGRRLASREADFSTSSTCESALRDKFQAVYRALAVAASEVNGATKAGFLAKEYARCSLLNSGIEVPSSLATRTPSKKPKRRRRGKKP